MASEPVGLESVPFRRRMRSGRPPRAPFYKQHVVADGMLFVGSQKVSAYALCEAAYLAKKMLANRPGSDSSGSKDPPSELPRSAVN